MTGTIQIALAPTEFNYIESLVRVGEFPSPSLYVEDLVRRDTAANARLRDMLVSGMNSGFGCEWSPELGNQMLAEAKARRARVV